MATKLFFTKQAHSTINPGTLFTWGSSVKSVCKLVPSSHATYDASYTNTGYSGYGAGTVIYRQFISEPLSAGIVFDDTTTYETCMRVQESSSAANAYSLFGVAIVSSDGLTVRDKFDALEKDGTEMSSTDLTARANIRSGTSGLNYTTVAGDRLVVEIGWDQDASSSYTITMSNGYLGDGGLSGDGDIGTDDPWIEFSNTITFGGSDPAPPATNEDYELTAYITGVLDEWV